MAVGRLGYVIPMRLSRSRRAGLLFPVGQIHRSLRKRYNIARVGKMAPIYMTAVLEYTMAEILETAGVLSRLLTNRRHGEDLHITPRHIRLAIVNDEELSKVFDGAILPSSGGGNYISKKNIRQIKGTVDESSDDEKEVERRKGGHKASRANSKNSNNPEHETISSSDEEDSTEIRKKGSISTKYVKDNNHGNKKAKPSKSSISTSLMPEVDGQTFDTCKNAMRAVKETIVALDSTNPRKSSKEQLAITRRCLVKIGNHVESLIGNLSKEEARDWRYNYWFYVSNFSDLNAQELYQTYIAVKEGSSGSH